MEKTVPISEKALLTIDEASKYFNIGSKRLYQMVHDWQDEHNYKYILMIGTKCLIKRTVFLDYLYKQSEI